MKEKELKIDRTCHAIYSKSCKKEILKRISSHYEVDEVDAIFEKVQHQFERFLAEFNHKDLGGKKNFHNGRGGTYDCIMIASYYVICKKRTSFDEIEQIIKDITTDSSRSLNFINIDKPFWKHLMYFAFYQAEKKCRKWWDFDMRLDPYSKTEPIHYHFKTCPVADFIHQFGLEEIAGALCNADYACMASMNVKLVRCRTLIESNCCDYTFYSPNDPRLKDHPQYVDEQGFIRNK